MFKMQLDILEGNIERITQALQLSKVCACQTAAQAPFCTVISYIFQHLAGLDISLVCCMIQNTVWSTVPCRQTVMLEEIDCIEEQIIHE